MAAVWTINPRKSRKARKSRKSRKVRAVKRRVIARKRRRNPKKFAVAHVVRRARRVKRRVIARKSRRSRCANPRLIPNMATLKSALVPALVGGAGAVALDVALRYVPLPPMLQGNVAKTAVKVAGAFGIGFVAGKLLGSDKGRAVTAGALTVIAYGLVSNAIARVLPAPAAQPVSGYDGADMSVGAYMNELGYMGEDSVDNATPLDGLGAYMSDGM